MRRLIIQDTALPSGSKGMKNIGKLKDLMFVIRVLLHPFEYFLETQPIQ